MPNIHVYIDSSYWQSGDGYDMSAIAFLGQCLVANKARFNIHFNNIGEDVNDDLKKTMSGTEGAPISPILELIHTLGIGKSGEEMKDDKDQAYDKSYFIRRTPIDDYRGTIIFSKMKKSLESLEKEYGYGLISETSFEKLKVAMVKKGEEVNDSFLKSDLKYCNSVVIVDRFALKDTWTIENNLLPILKEIKSTSSIAQITILSQFSSRTEKSPISMDDAFNKMKAICKTEDKWRIEICDVKEYYHDRFIITNNNYITIGGGLDCRSLSKVKKVGSKTTTIHKYLYPLFQEEISKEVKFYIDSIKDMIRGLDRSNRKSNMDNGASNYLLTKWI